MTLLTSKSGHSHFFMPARRLAAAALCTLFAVASMGASAQVYRFGHCLLGCPVGSAPDNKVLVRAIYTLSYNPVRKTADWVAYEVSADSIGIASSLSRTLVADPDVGEALTMEDLFALDEENLVRTQYAPLVSFAGTPFWQEVNYATNVAVRSRGLSQGAWYGLDWAVRNLVNREAEVFVVTGPVFNAVSSAEAEIRTLPANPTVRIPDGFFKVILTREGEAAAFLFSQDTPVHVHHCDLRSSLADIQNLTGLEFFPEGASRLSFTLYSALGCSS